MTIIEIKSRLPIREVLQHYQLTPDRNAMLKCPFHEDNTASLKVYEKTNSFNCFGCGKGGDVLKFIQYKENTTVAAALQKARSLLPAYIQQSSPAPQTAQATLSRSEILHSMFSYFKHAVYNSSPARDYIKQRGLDAAKIEIGYNTGQFHHGARREEQLITNCVSIGLLYPWGTNTKRPEQQAYKPFAKYCICFALRDRGHHITGLYFRSTFSKEEEAKLPAGASRHYYLKESSGLYPCYPKPDTRKLIIAESIIDTASLLQIESIAKEYSLLAAYGANRLNEEMKTAIQELKNLSEIVFAFDNDEAGNAATAKYSRELQELLPHVIISKLDLPCKDVNETLLAHSEDIFLHLLENRNFIFSSGNHPEENEIKKEAQVAETVATTQAATPNTNETNHTSGQSAKKANTLNTLNPYKLVFTSPSATYLIKGGLDKVMNKLSVTLEIENQNSPHSISKRRFKLDLYDNRQLEKTIEEASELLHLHKPVLEQDLHELTEHLDHYRERELLPPAEESKEPELYILTGIEKNEAMELAIDRNLMSSIKEKLSQTGIVGEEENKLFLFLIAASHIQENPLNALIQGSSGSGKTNLLKGIYKTIPEESKKIFSRCSEKMLYNVPKYYFKNKLVCFEDVDGLGEEAEYAWRELMSNGELISGVSYKDDKGNIGIKELVVCGPISTIACTTHGVIYADNMSRMFLIAIDESKAQTRRINEYQAKEAAGFIDKAEQQKTIRQLQNFIRILQACKVYNPHAGKLTLPEGIQDERRLYKLYLHFIEIITVLHQHQRRRLSAGNKLITTKQDCQIAKDLMFECIMLKMDELDGSLRQFFERLKDYIHKQNNTGYEFTQREIRTNLQVKKTQLSYYINELISLEYIQQTSSHMNKGNRYKILHFDNYRKIREEVKAFLQKQIDELAEE